MSMNYGTFLPKNYKSTEDAAPKYLYHKVLAQYSNIQVFRVPHNSLWQNSASTQELTASALF